MIKVKIQLGIAVALFAIVGAIAGGPHAYADNRNPLNDAEKDAKWKCYNEPGTQGGARGAIWFTNNSYYYNDSVDVSSNAQTVNVDIRGSVYGCVYGSPGKIYAVNIKPAAPNASRLYGLSSTTLYRGALPSPAPHNWTSKGGQIGAKLDISWIPKNTSTSPKKTTFYVGIYRCYEQNGVRGTCYAEDIQVSVVRAGVPGRNWSSSGTTTATVYNNATSTVRAATTGGTAIAYPGDAAIWSHQLKVTGFNGPGSVTVNVTRKRTGDFANSSNTTSFTLSGNVTKDYGDPWKQAGKNYSRLFSASDVGKTFCSVMSWTPEKEGTGSGGSPSNDACVAVESNFNIIPMTLINGASAREAIGLGESATPFSNAINSGLKNPNVATQATAYTFKFNVNQALPTFSEFNKSYKGHAYVDIASGAACDWLRSKYNFVNASCVQTAQKSDSFAGDTPTAANQVDATSINADSYQVGEKVCRILVAKHYNAATDAGTDTHIRLGLPACVVIAKRPLVKVLGNDLRVGSALAVGSNQNSKVLGGMGVIDGKVRGSWAEYGILAPDTVNAFASGSRFANDGAASGQADWSRLTFANDGAYGKYTEATGMGGIPDTATYFSVTKMPSGITKTVTSNTSLSSYASNTIIMDSGTVTISSSINAPNNNINTGESGMTQMIIIAKGDIRISQNVKNIDAWLIAPNGTIDTCYDVSDPLTTAQCKEQLTITGPVMAKSFKLRRTYGAKGEFSEIVNLRSDSYVWAKNLSSKTGTLQTKYITELPPRY